MAWIQMIGEKEATGELKQLYDSERRQAGALANILKIHSLAPETLSAHLDLYLAVMHRSGELSRTRREMIALVVSSVNGCNY